MAVAKGNFQTLTRGTSAVSGYTEVYWDNLDSPAPPSVASGDLILVAIAYPANTSLSDVTLDGTSLTNAGTNYHSTMGIREEFWYSTSPATGITDLVLTFSSAMSAGQVSTTAMCFSGASGVGTPAFYDGTSDPNSQSLSVSADGMVYACGAANVAHDDITIDGNVVTGASGNLLPNQTNINKIYSGSTSGSTHSAGSVTIETDGSFGNISNSHIEILASGGGGFDPTLPDDGDFFMMF